MDSWSFYLWITYDLTVCVTLTVHNTKCELYKYCKRFLYFLFPVDILATLLFIRLTEQPDFRRYQEEVNIRG